MCQIRGFNQRLLLIFVSSVQSCCYRVALLNKLASFTCVLILFAYSIEMLSIFAIYCSKDPIAMAALTLQIAFSLSTQCLDNKFFFYNMTNTLF